MSTSEITRLMMSKKCQQVRSMHHLIGVQVHVTAQMSQASQNINIWTQNLDNHYTISRIMCTRTNILSKIFFVLNKKQRYQQVLPIKMGQSQKKIMHPIQASIKTLTYMSHLTRTTGVTIMDVSPQTATQPIMHAPQNAEEY